MPGFLAAIEPSDSPSWALMLRQIAGDDGAVEEWQDIEHGIRLARAFDVTSGLAPQSSLLVGEDAVVVVEGRLLPVSHTQSDAERILGAYRRHGVECARHLLGEFAFALWDRMQHRFLAGSDPVGIRSVAYCATGNALLVCSRSLALLHHPRVPKRLDAVYLAHALCDLWAQPPGMTPFASVRRVRPGFALVARNGRTFEERVDCLSAAPPGGSRWTSEDSIVRFWECLEGVVRDAIHDESLPVVELSSGLDSTAVALCALKVNPRHAAISAVAPASGADEEKLIRGFVAAHPGLRWHAIDCSDDRALGEPWESLPVPDDPCVLAAAFLPARLRMARAARDLGYRLLVDGDGGDEMFGLAPRLVDLVASGALRSTARYMAGRGWRSALLRELLVPILPAVLLRKWAARERRRVDPIPAWLSTYFRNSDPLREALAQRTEWLRVRRARDALPALLHVAPSVGSRQALRLLQGSLGVRSRSPLMDRRLIELSLAIPPALVADPERSKIFLRKAMQGRAPSATLHQPKNNRLYVWFQSQGLGNRDLRARLDLIRKRPVLADLVQVDAVERTIGAACAARGVAMGVAEQICSLLSLDKWLKLTESSIGTSLYV